MSVGPQHGAPSSDCQLMTGGGGVMSWRPLVESLKVALLINLDELDFSFSLRRNMTDYDTDCVQTEVFQL